MKLTKEYPIYLLSSFAFIFSIYIHVNATKFIHFLIASLITFSFFVGIYFCFNKITKSTVIIKILKIFGIIILAALIYFSWVFSTLYGFHSSYCYNLVGRNIFTGDNKVYCNYPPWYTNIVGGEEARKILLDDCLSRESEFYDKHPNYCDVYKKLDDNRDWTKGPNP